MSGFEAIFAFYALLLGLAVANVTSAFANMYKARRKTAVGWTTPLLGIVILLSASQQWIALFRAQADIAIGLKEILACLGMALPYIFASQAMTPRDGEVASLEDYYADHRLVLVWALLTPICTSAILNLVYTSTLDRWSVPVVMEMLLYQGVRFACLIPMLIWPAAAVQRAGLLALAAYTVFLMI
ncbi:hypothetical protein ACFPIF_09755 [Brevundimonas faecalis]|uniref:hypothetical protein n=1 Tax=Brevundimonas faecalis TaxID=947378 RepID=UPI0036157708